MVALRATLIGYQALLNTQKEALLLQLFAFPRWFRCFGGVAQAVAPGIWVSTLFEQSRSIAPSWR